MCCAGLTSPVATPRCLRSHLCLHTSTRDLQATRSRCRTSQPLQLHVHRRSYHPERETKRQRSHEAHRSRHRSAACDHERMPLRPAKKVPAPLWSPAAQPSVLARGGLPREPASAQSSSGSGEQSPTLEESSQSRVARRGTGREGPGSAIAQHEDLACMSEASRLTPHEDLA